MYRSGLIAALAFIVGKVCLPNLDDAHNRCVVLDVNSPIKKLRNHNKHNKYGRPLLKNYMPFIRVVKPKLAKRPRRETEICKQQSMHQTVDTVICPEIFQQHLSVTGSSLFFQGQMAAVSVLMTADTDPPTVVGTSPLIHCLRISFLRPLSSLYSCYNHSMGNKTNSNLIVSLQALRGIAAMTVLIDHSNLVNNLGCWGVVVFFTMSGFLMALNYVGKGRIKDYSALSNARFAYDHFRKLYPLHIVTMFSLALLELTGAYRTPLPSLIAKIFMNITLQYDWFPDFRNFLINPSAWFVSALWLSYFLFPWLLKALEKKKVMASAIHSILFLLFIQIVMSLSIIHTAGVGPLGANIANHREYLIYMFPPMTFLEFSVGALLGVVYLSRNHMKLSKAKASILEIATIFLNLLFIQFLLEDKCNVFWLTFPCAFLVYLFAANRGIVSKVLTNRASVFLGNYSMEIFLIHYPVFQYLEAAIVFLLGRAAIRNGMVAYNITIGITLTILLSVLWKRITSRLKKYGKHYTSC